MNENISSEAEAMFEKALAVAERHVAAALREAGELANYVSIAMIEAAVNHAIEVTSAADIVDVLRGMADQIESDQDESDEEGEE